MLKMVKFWIVAFYHIIRQTLKGNGWSQIVVDIDLGEVNGKQTRRKLIAARAAGGFRVYWQRDK